MGWYGGVLPAVGGARDVCSVVWFRPLVVLPPPTGILLLTTTTAVVVMAARYE